MSQNALLILLLSLGVTGNGLALELPTGTAPSKVQRLDIVDRQELTTPPNFPVGDYTMHVGFFSGSKRLEVKSGPQDGADRVRAGVLRVR